VPGYYLVAFGDLLLDVEVQVGRSGSQPGYKFLEALYGLGALIGGFPRSRSVVYDVGRKQFVE
jgi:hypothetical protein